MDTGRAVQLTWTLLACLASVIGAHDWGAFFCFLAVERTCRPSLLFAAYKHMSVRMDPRGVAQQGYSCCPHASAATYEMR